MRSGESNAEITRWLRFRENNSYAERHKNNSDFYSRISRAAGNSSRFFAVNIDILASFSIFQSRSVGTQIEKSTVSFSRERKRNRRRGSSRDCVFVTFRYPRVYIPSRVWRESLRVAIGDRLRSSGTDSSRTNARFLTIGRANAIVYVDGLVSLGGDWGFPEEIRDEGDRYFIFVRRIVLRSKHSVLERGEFVGQDAYT